MNKDDSELVTRGFLRKELKRELGGLRNEMVAGNTGLRSELRAEMQEMGTMLRAEMQDIKLELEEKMYTKQAHKVFAAWVQEEFRSIREDMATKQDVAKLMEYMDEAITELRDMREDRILFVRQFGRMDDRVEDHEKRIGVLEGK